MAALGRGRLRRPRIFAPARDAGGARLAGFLVRPPGGFAWAGPGSTGGDPGRRCGAGRVAAGGTAAWVPAAPVSGAVRVMGASDVPLSCGRRIWMIPARTAATTMRMPTRRTAEPLSIEGGLAPVERMNA